MNCDAFRKYWIENDTMAPEDDLWGSAIEHFHTCSSCSDAVLANRLNQRGVDIESYPCVHMAEYAEFYCEHHPEPEDCEDAVLLYQPAFDEYAIKHGDGSSRLQIQYCPWCGSRLPKSKRDLWFDTLQKMGYDDPAGQDIPDEFESRSWYRRNEPKARSE